MVPNNAFLEEVEYRVLLLHRGSGTILTRDNAEGTRLPRIRVTPWVRLAEQMQEAIKQTWGLHVLVLDLLPVHENGFRCVAAELLVLSGCPPFVPVRLSHVAESDLSGPQRLYVERLFGTDSEMPFATAGWIDECISWVESATQQRIASRKNIQQYNASPTFSLLRFLMEDGRHCWFKATGSPNTQELSVTLMLSSLCDGFLPAVIATRPAWNAWLMWEEATSILDSSKEARERSHRMEAAVSAMAHLQLRTQGHCDDLLRAGVFDQRPATLRKSLHSFVGRLDEWMGLQTSTKVPRVTQARLIQIHQILEVILDRVERLRIPNTILHGDLNQGNILFGKRGCQFIDWCEAYVGHPLISFQHLLLLNKEEDATLQALSDRMLRDRYRSIWSLSCDPVAFDEAFVYMPLLAIVSALYGRGSWADTNITLEPERQSFARSLTRALDRAAREPQLVERLCA